VSHASKLLLLSCLASALACTVPTLDELEAENPSGCNADHQCPADSVCFENRCIRTAGLACTPGTQEPCGSDEGMCSKGLRLCGKEGTFGACQGEVTPVFERCDGEDNDCDGRRDNFTSINLSRHTDLSSPVVAIPVDRAAVGKAHTVLSVTTEPEGLVTRTFSADGVLRPGETLAPNSPDNIYEKPALVADGDTVAAAWIQRTFGSKAPPQVFLTLLDGSGKRTSQLLGIPYTDGSSTALPIASELKVAINATHILLLVTTTSGGPTLGSEVWAVTVARGLTPGSISVPFRLAVPGSSFGLHATANGKSDRFLVAYDNNGAQYVGVISNAGALVGTPVLATRGSDNHSPFIVPNKDTDTGYTLYYVSVQTTTDGTRSDLTSFTCTATACLSSSLYSYAGNLERVQMAPRPGELMPNFALLIARESVSDARVLFVALISPKQVERISAPLVAPGATHSETLVLLPDASRYVLYQHDVTSLAASAVVLLSSEAYLQPFCGP
jgi:hypothetical protein